MKVYKDNDYDENEYDSAAPSPADGAFAQMFPYILGMEPLAESDDRPFINLILIRSHAFS